MRERTRVHAGVVRSPPRPPPPRDDRHGRTPPSTCRRRPNHGVTVCGTSGILTPTSELTWGLIHALARQIVADDGTMRAGGWQTRMGIGLAGRRLGLLGLGRLGALVARVGIAFGMDVVAWSQNLTAERAADVGVRLVDKDELLRDVGRRLDPPRAQRSHPRPHRCRGAGADEADGVPGQHLPRSDRRPRRAGCRPPRRNDRRRRPRRLRRGAAADRRSVAGACRTRCSRRTPATSSRSATRSSTATSSTTSPRGRPDARSASSRPADLRPDGRMLVERYGAGPRRSDRGGRS